MEYTVRENINYDSYELEVFDNLDEALDFMREEAAKTISIRGTQYDQDKVYKKDWSWTIIDEDGDTIEEINANVHG